jgi:RNase P/RNase MRP subunit p29
MVPPLPMPDAPLSPDESEALSGEILGATVVIERSPGLVPLPFRGTLVDETLQTFLVRPVGGTKARRIQKTGLVGVILLGERQLPLRGETLRVRPEDRTKRLSARGRRKFR